MCLLHACEFKTWISMVPTNGGKNSKKERTGGTKITREYKNYETAEWFGTGIVLDRVGEW